MPMNLDAVGSTSDPVTRQWTSTDCLLYALGVGAGALDPTGYELEYTTENSAEVEQRVLPTFATIIGVGGAARTTLGSFDPAMLVHGEQSIELHAPITTSGAISTTSTVVGIYDKGSGALAVIESLSVDASSGAPCFTTRTALFIRGEGGFGGDRGPSGKIEFPERKPDHLITYHTRPDQALLYRLSGDRNPHNSDPTIAARGGFDKPILQGLCTFGFTGRALLHSLCGSDPDRFVSMEARFSKPVIPGQDLAVSMWVTDRGRALYRTDTDSGTVIDGGQFTYKV